MTGDGNNHEPQPPRPKLLPAMVVISLYMLILAGFNILSVVSGQVRPLYLLFSAAFIAASLGVLRLLRWAWALTLAAMVLMACLFLGKFTVQHDFSSAAQGLLNLVIFFYLVRTEVRVRLR